MRSVLLLCAAALLLAGACGSGAATGAPCSGAGDCEGGVCLQSQDFPDGYCSMGCSLDDPSSCPSGSTCIDDASGAPSNVTAVCYELCKTSGDCGRDGYACLEKSNQLVCRSGT